MLPNLDEPFANAPSKGGVPRVPCVPSAGDPARARVPVGHVSASTAIAACVPRVPQVVWGRRNGTRGTRHDAACSVARVQRKPNSGAGLRGLGHEGHTGHDFAKESRSNVDRQLDYICAANDAADREAFEERAAIMEFDGGLPREEAECLALKDDSPPISNLGYTLTDLAEFDELIERYCELAFADVGKRDVKCLELLTARRRMAPARAMVELAEFHALLDEILEGGSSSAAVSSRQFGREDNNDPWQPAKKPVLPISGAMREVCQK